MIEYQIPGAGLLSAAVIAICFVIALIVINAQTPGRSRTLGVVGVVLLFASAIAGALNGSLGSAYGTHSVAYGAGSIAIAVLTAVGLVLLALAVVMAGRGKSGRAGGRMPRGDH